MLQHDRAQGLGADIGDVKAAGLAVPFHQGDNHHLAHRTMPCVQFLVGVLILLLAADVDLIRFDDLPLATDRGGRRISSGFPKAMKQKP
jgi:hypothetical protein